MAPQGSPPPQKSVCFTHASRTPSPPAGRESQLINRAICIFPRHHALSSLFGLQTAISVLVEGSWIYICRKYVRSYVPLGSFFMR